MARSSTVQALGNYFRRQANDLEREQRPRRKNQSPEMDLVQKPCKSWFRQNGWSMFILDAKAKWNSPSQSYIANTVEAGFSDAFGAAVDGTSAWVEFKAPGRLSSLKPHQRAFLEDKIQMGCFAIVTDSVDRLADLWAEFSHRRKMEPQLAKSFLLRHLPPAAEEDDADPFASDR